MFHLGRQWSPDNQPNLAQDFIECKPSKRIFAVTDPNEDELFIIVNHDCMARRALPYLPEPDL